MSTARQWIQARQRPPFQTIVGEGPYLKFLHAQFPALEIHKGLVIRRLERPNTPDRRQVLLPAPPRTEALQMAHAERTAGHLGTTRTLAALRHRFLWPRMRRDVQFAIAACDTCARHKNPLKKQCAPLRGYHVGTPMERVTIDIVGPFPETPRGTSSY